MYPGKVKHENEIMKILISHNGTAFFPRLDKLRFKRDDHSFNLFLTMIIQLHTTTFLFQITVHRSIYCLEFSNSQERLNISG